METRSIQQAFLEKTCEQIEILEEGANRFRIFTPFTFGDGDHIAIVLKQERGQWILSDEGDTLSHLSLLGVSDTIIYGTRRSLVDGILQEFNAENWDGELVARIEHEQYGSALYNFVQTIVKISDLVYLSKERVKSTFLEGFKNLIKEAIPNENRYEFDWHDGERDPDARYKVDCRINHLERPLAIFALQNDEKIRVFRIWYDIVMTYTFSGICSHY
jgi:hypothetical protein